MKLDYATQNVKENCAGFGENPSLTSPLAVNRQEIAAFVNALFRHADDGNHVSLRAFEDNKGGKTAQTTFWATPQINGAGLVPVIDAAVRLANACAQAPVPAVCCPPVCTFATGKDAAEANVANGLGLSVECDANPYKTRNRLEALIGPATVVVASGGEWTDPETGEVQERLHLHWRLQEPTREASDHARLKEARRLATRLCGADASNVPLVHPIRWPGTWHRKAAPKLARIVSLNEDAEIDLGEALERLREAVGSMPEAPVVLDAGAHVSADPEASVFDVAAALDVIPNPDLEWEDWNNIGLAIWAATGGSEAGFGLFLGWSSKSGKKCDVQDARGRWLHYRTAPPNKIGAGTLFYMAQQAQPGWRKPSDVNNALPLAWPGVPEQGQPTPIRRSPRGVMLEDFYAYSPSHTYIYIPTRAMWSVSSVNSRIPPVPVLDEHGNQKLDEKDKPIKIGAATWLDQNSPVEQMTWVPGVSEIIEGRLLHEGGWVEKQAARAFNQYLAPRIKLGDAQAAVRWVDHVRFVYPDEAEHIINWLAHRAQRPGEKVNHALVLGGPPGIGKDTILEPVKAAIGPWNFAEVDPGQVMGRFNGFVKSVILRISEARDLGEMDRFSFYDHTKTLTAAPPDTIRVDEKFQKEHYVINCCGVIITTNHKTDGIYLPADDRRHYVAWSEVQKTDPRFAGDYWQDMYEWFANGGNEAVAAFLMQRDISGFRAKSPPPQTAAFYAIADANVPQEEGELNDVLDQMLTETGKRRPAITVYELAEHAGKTHGGLEEWILDRKNRRTIPHRLEKCGYVPVRYPHGNEGLWIIAGRRQVIYARSDLSTKERVAAAEERAKHGMSGRTKC